MTTAPNYPLTTERFTAMMRVSRVENESMYNALHAVLVLHGKVSPTAARYGITRQLLERRVKYVEEVLKPAFDEYAALTHTD